MGSVQNQIGLLVLDPRVHEFESTRLSFRAVIKLLNMSKGRFQTIPLGSPFPELDDGTGSARFWEASQRKGYTKAAAKSAPSKASKAAKVLGNSEDPGS